MSSKKFISLFALFMIIHASIDRMTKAELPADKSSAPSGGFQSIGLGGGGAMFCPASSPHDPNLIFVSCDMGGFYRSEDGGKSWRMLDKRQIRNAISCPPIFHPKDPNVIFAYGDGKLRISRDKGLTWKPFTEAPPWGTDPLVALGIDRGNPNLMFAGTDGAAYRTTDAGKTWEKLSGVPGRVVGFYIDQTSPTERRRCFIGTSAGVFRSEDGGVTWQDSSNGLPWRDLRGFCGGADTTSGKVALYCTIPSKAVDRKFVGGVYRSLDRGASWQMAMGKGINTDLGKKDEYGADDIAQYSFIAMAETQPNIVYVTTSGTGYWPPHHWTVYRTEDGGETWHYCVVGDPRSKREKGVEVNVEAGWIVHDRVWGWWGGPPLGFSVNSANPDQAMFTNAGELYITNNGGKTWRQAYSRRAVEEGAPTKGQSWTSIGLEVTSCWQFAFDPHDRNRAYIAYTDIGFARSEDRGKTWYHSVEGSPWRNTFYQIAFDPDRPGTIYAACSNQHDIPHWTNIEQIRLGGGVCLSEDYGKTWRPLRNGLPDAPATSIVLDPKSPKEARTLYVAIFGQGVFKSTDSGATWHKASRGLGLPDNQHVYSLKLHPDGTLFCSITGKRIGREFPAPGGLYRSKDKGETWECITKNLPLRWPGDFDFHPKDSKIIYLAAASAPGFPQGGLYKTTDGGDTWQQLLKESDFPPELCSFVHAFFVLVNPKQPQTIYLSATTHGLFISRDAGATWREIMGIPFTAVQRVTIDPEEENTIWVTTFGGGVWKGPALGTR